MSLRDWVDNGWLVEHVASSQEVADLLGVCDRDLLDCSVAGLSADWRFAIAYNAALQVATTALAVAGYRAARDAHHYRAIQSLAHTVGADAGLVRRLDASRKKRNIGGYESAGRISDHEAAEMASLAVDLRARVEKWIRAERPDLLA